MNTFLLASQINRQSDVRWSAPSPWQETTEAGCGVDTHFFEAVWGTA